MRSGSRRREAEFGSVSGLICEEGLKGVTPVSNCMVLDELSQEERRNVFAVAGAAVLAAVIVGYGAGSMSTPTGDLASGASQEDVRGIAESIAQQQEASQQQRMSLMANQSENISEEDLSFNAEVDSVNQSRFGSLYRVDIAVTGDTVSRLGQVESIDQTTTLYVSGDGRYVFQQPTDLQEQRQQQTQGQPTPAPSGQ